jgi:type III secretory pathway component EscT
MSDLLQFLLDLWLWVPRQVFAWLLDALASLFESIPVPDFVTQAASALSSIGGNVLFFAEKFAVPEGVAMVLSAYVLRFLIRRIPFIG